VAHLSIAQIEWGNRRFCSLDKTYKIAIQLRYFSANLGLFCRIEKNQRYFDIYLFLYSGCEQGSVDVWVVPQICDPDLLSDVRSTTSDVCTKYKPHYSRPTQSASNVSGMRGLAWLNVCTVIFLSKVNQKWAQFCHHSFPVATNRQHEYNVSSQKPAPTLCRTPSCVNT